MREVVDIPSRRLRSNWILEESTTFSVIYGIDLEAEMADILVQEMASEITNTINQNVVDDLLEKWLPLAEEGLKNKKIDHFENESELFEVT